MRKRRALGIATAAAFCVAAAVTLASEPMSTSERVTRIEAEKAHPTLVEELRDWSPAVNATLFDYAGSDELTLAARLALTRFPLKAEKVLGLYGTSAEFKQILLRYGPQVVLPIHYFMVNDSVSLTLRDAAIGMFSTDEDESVSEETTGGDGNAAPDQSSEDEGLTPAERGWYAVGFIRDEGHDFLGQFVTDGEGDVSWVQTERWFTGAKRFFTSGITSFESKWQRNEELSSSDYGWAAVDVLAPIAVFKAAKAAKAAKAGRVASRTAKTTKTSSRAAKIGTGALRLAAKPAKYAVLLGTAGYAVAHPSVLSSIGSGIAKLLGFPVFLVQLVLWFVVLLPIFLLCSVCYRWVIRPVRAALAIVISALTWMHKRVQKSTGESGASSQSSVMQASA